MSGGVTQTKQSIILKNLLHFSGRINEQSFAELFVRIEEILKENEATQTGCNASATKAVLIENGQQVVDIDLFVPTDRVLRYTGDFNFIPEIKIEKALKLHIEREPSDIHAEIDMVHNSVKEVAAAIAPPLVVTVKDEKTLTSETTTDIYVGINDRYGIMTLSCREQYSAMCL